MTSDIPILDPRSDLQDINACISLDVGTDISIDVITATMSWESIAATKRQALKDSIPSEWVIPADIFPPEDQLDVSNFPKESGFFTERELEIIATTAPIILSHLASGSWTSEEVTKTFCKAAAVAQQLVFITISTS